MDNTNRKDDELLSAYIDGELPPDDAAALVERMASEPALVRRLEAMRSGDAAVRAVYEKLDQEPLPEGVTQLLSTAGDAPLKDRVVAFRGRGMPRFVNWPVAVAAGVALVAGFLALRQMQEVPQLGPVDALVAGEFDTDGEILDLLEHGISGRPEVVADTGEMRVILSFESESGTYCRQLYVTDVGQSAHGVACKGRSGWELEAVAPGAPGTPGAQFQAAAGDAPAAVSSAVENLIGPRDPLSVEEEMSLISTAWKIPAD